MIFCWEDKLGKKGASKSLKYYWAIGDFQGNLFR